jgi:hypothetical protein
VLNPKTDINESIENRYYYPDSHPGNLFNSAIVYAVGVVCRKIDGIESPARSDLGPGELF